MDERWVLALYIISMLVIGLGSLLLVKLVYSSMRTSWDLYVYEYRALLLENGTYIENITYVKGGGSFHVLYRFWREKVGLRDTGSVADYNVVVYNIKCSDGQPYISTTNRTYTLSPEGSFIEKPIPYAGHNEVGCYFPRGVQNGRHWLYTVYMLKPRIYYDRNSERYIFWFRLADKHIPYNNLVLELKDANIDEVYVNP